MTEITTDRDRGVATTAAGERLIVDKDVTIGTTTYALKATFADNVLINYGHLTTQAHAVVMSGDGDRFINKASGEVWAQSDRGVELTGNHISVTNLGSLRGGNGIVGANAHDVSIVNEGLLDATTRAIYFTGDQNGDISINNSGRINGFAAAVNVSNPTGHLSLVNTGSISGGSAFMDGLLGSVSIDNSGQINGEFYLIEAAAAATITNSGIIYGDLLLTRYADLFDGAAGDQHGPISGGEGADSIYGGGVSETITGGLGADLLDGGGGADVFVYGAVRDSGRGGHDLIRNWESGDRLDLSHIDADKDESGRQHASFGGEVVAGSTLPKAEVVYYHQGGDTFVLLGHTGGARFPLTVEIAGEVTLSAGDFVL